MGNTACWQRDGVSVGISEEVSFHQGSLAPLFFPGLLLAPAAPSLSARVR